MLEHAQNTRPRGHAPILTACGLTLGLGLTVLAASPAAADPTVVSTTLAATPSVVVGDPVTVDLDLAEATDVYAYQVTLSFDPTLFAYSPGGESSPDGGFDSVESGDGTVTLVHTRLGTSPSLSGDLSAAVTLTAVGSGDGTVAAAVTLVGADGTSTQTAADPAEVQVAAVEVEPTPTPSTSAPVTSPPTTGTPTTSAPGSPPDPGTTPDAAAPGAEAPSTTAPDGSLATTGFGAAALVVTAAAAIAAGAVLRRRSAGAR